MYVTPADGCSATCYSIFHGNLVCDQSAGHYPASVHRAPAPKTARGWYEWVDMEDRTPDDQFWFTGTVGKRTGEGTPGSAKPLADRERVQREIADVAAIREVKRRTRGAGRAAEAESPC